MNDVLTIFHSEKNDDPYTHLSAELRKDGKVVVIVTATHFSGGWEQVFGDRARNHRTYSAFVQGIDHAGPDGVRTAALVTNQKTYILGHLADGTYLFKAGNPDRLLATLTIQVSEGRLVNTPAWPGPWAPARFAVQGDTATG